MSTSRSTPSKEALLELDASDIEGMALDVRSSYRGAEETDQAGNNAVGLPSVHPLHNRSSICVRPETFPPTRSLKAGEISRNA